MNTTRIYLVRHGATQLTAEDRFSGSAGVDLYAAGEEDSFTFTPEGGESGVAVLAHALPVIRTIVTRTAISACSSSPTRRRSASSLAVSSASTRVVTATAWIKRRRV